MLSNMIQNNYRMDDENQLWLVDSSEDVILFTHERGQDGGYSIKDAVFAEKGDNYMSSVEALLIETGESVDDLEETLETSRVFVLYDLKDYLKEHPEVKGIEYEGEIRTAEELDQIWNVKLDELYDKYGDGSSSQEAAADSGTNTAPAAE
jgi:2-hydroxy-3-keto-5-methylthiopentenyl-1-phosphate phosphatase